MACMNPLKGKWLFSGPFRDATVEFSTDGDQLKGSTTIEFDGKATDFKVVLGGLLQNGISVRFSARPADIEFEYYADCVGEDLFEGNCSGDFVGPAKLQHIK